MCPCTFVIPATHLRKFSGMVNVLIPTDFSPASLDRAAIAVRVMEERHNILLFHAVDMPDSLREALSKAGINSYSAWINEAIRLKCKRMKAANNLIGNISFRVMYGTTVAAFKGFAEANAIDTIIIPAGYSFSFTLRESINPLQMFHKSGIKLYDMTNDASMALSDTPRILPKLA